MESSQLSVRWTLGTFSSDAHTTSTNINWSALIILDESMIVSTLRIIMWVLYYDRYVFSRLLLVYGLLISCIANIKSNCEE